MMRGIIIAILVVILIGLILTILWPAIMATLGAVLGFYSLKKLLETKSVGEKVVYGILIGIGALMILTNLKGAIVVLVIAAIVYFLTKNNRNKRNDNNDTFDYPYNK
ncbi:Uncharacterised protein [Listeria fleischmannii subsp. coloradonensis]|jgi:predicted membrane protein|nr:Uncharacterised protein [Listeria fleischmannii subsp. coloradonensis]